MKKIVALFACLSVLFSLSLGGISVLAAENNSSQTTLQDIETENNVQYDSTHSIQPRLNGAEFMIPPRWHKPLPAPNAYKFIKCAGALAIVAISGQLWSLAGGGATALGCLP